LTKSKVLPLIFEGSPQNKIRNYQDLIAIVRNHGEADFVPIICDPKGSKVVEDVENRQSPEFKSDFVSQVSKMKLQALMDEKRKKLCTLTAGLHIAKFLKHGWYLCIIWYTLENFDLQIRQ
jgi:hypothetical protein